MMNEYIVDFEAYNENCAVIGYGNIAINVSEYVTGEAIIAAVYEQVSKGWCFDTKQIRIRGVFKL